MSHSEDSLGDDTLTPYQFSMEEIGLGLSRLTEALATDDTNTIAKACSEARLVYRRMVHLYPKLQLDPTKRDSLLEQLSLLRWRIEECEGRTKRSTAAGS